MLPKCCIFCPVFFQNKIALTLTFHFEQLPYSGRESCLSFFFCLFLIFYFFLNADQTELYRVSSSQKPHKPFHPQNLLLLGSC